MSYGLPGFIPEFTRTDLSSHAVLGLKLNLSIGIEGTEAPIPVSPDHREFSQGNSFPINNLTRNLNIFNIGGEKGSLNFGGVLPDDNLTEVVVSFVSCMNFTVANF